MSGFRTVWNLTIWRTSGRDVQLSPIINVDFFPYEPINFYLGHMYCQQILRKTWHGNVPWQAAPFTFKIIHFLLQLTFAPLFALMQAIAEWIREIYKLKVKMLLQ